MKLSYGIIALLSVIALIMGVAIYENGFLAQAESPSVLENPIPIADGHEELDYSWLAYMVIVNGSEYTSANGVVLSRNIFLGDFLADEPRATVLTVFHFCDNFDLNTPILVYGIDGSEHAGFPYAFDPKSDLCLVAIIGEWEGSTLSTLVAPSEIPVQGELYTFGNPLGRFHGIATLPQHANGFNGNTVTFRFDGYYAGLYNDNAFAHSIRTNEGQSGSPLLHEGMIAGITLSRDTRTDAFGFAVRSDVIAEFLDRNGVPFDYVTSDQPETSSE